MNNRLASIRTRPGPLLAGLGALLLVLLALSPVERTLGQTIKLVYLHGALVRTAVLLFAVSLPLNGLALWQSRPAWVTWGKALAWTGTLTWLLHTLFSMITTYAAWGLFIAWAEPRTRFTFVLAGVAVLCLAVAYLVEHDRFTALVLVLLAGLAVGLLPGLGFIQHPLDPIGTSSSAAIRLYYAVILLVMALLGGLTAAWLQGRLAGRAEGAAGGALV